MAMEAENSNPKKGHTIPAVEQPVEKEETSNVEAQIRKLAQTLSPKQLETLAKIFTAEQTKKEEVRKEEVGTGTLIAVEKELFASKVPANDNKEGAEPQTPAVPLATAGGGGMQPPTDHTSENLESPKLEITEIEQDIQNEVVNSSIERENESIRRELTAKLEAEEQEKTQKAPVGVGEIGLQAVESALNNPSEKLPEAKLEIPVHEITNIDSQERWKHDMFGRLGARFERMGIKIKNAPKWTALETIRRFHAEGAAKIQVELDTQKKEVRMIEAKLAKREADAKMSAEKMSSGGFFDRLAAAKLEREKQNVLSTLEKAKAKQGQIEAKLEFKNKKLTSYQDRLGHQADAIAAGVDQRLAGDKADYETLTAKHEDLNKKLNSFKQTIEAAQNDLLLLEVRLKNKPEAAEKAEIKNNIIEAKKKIAELLINYKNLTTEKTRIQAMANRAQLYLSGWDGMRSPTQ